MLRAEKVDLAHYTAICQSAQKGIALLAGAGNPQVQLWSKEADADLKGGKPERAVAGYWGAALMALCASDPQAATSMAMIKGYSLPAIGFDAKANKPREYNEPLKAESWKVFTDVVATIKPIGNWKAIGPFDYDEKNPPGPEKNADFAAHHPGRGGEKAWVEVDPTKTWNDTGGSNLKVVLGDCRGGVAYIALDCEAAQAQKPFLTLSTRGPWTAFLDGKEIAARGEDAITIDMNRAPLDFPAGKHRLLVRMTPPGDDNILFRGGIGVVPELDCNILRFAWLQREYPGNFALMWGDAWWLLNHCQSKVPPQVMKTFGDALGNAYSGHAAGHPLELHQPRQRLLETQRHAGRSSGGLPLSAAPHRNQFLLWRAAQSDLGGDVGGGLRTLDGNLLRRRRRQTMNCSRDFIAYYPEITTAGTGFTR